MDSTAAGTATAVATVNVTTGQPPGNSHRLTGLDRLRGLAVLLMVLDHVLVVAAFFGYGVPELRSTVTRLAMPLFFVVAGSLITYSRRLSYDRVSRLALVVALGLALPLVVPWLDSPNVLVYYGFGYVAVWAVRDLLGRSPAYGRVCLGALVLCVVLLANGYSFAVGTGYDPLALLALLFLGTYLGSGQLDRWGSVLPRWLAWCGRFPLSVYVAHLLVLQGGALWLVGV